MTNPHDTGPHDTGPPDGAVDGGPGPDGAVDGADGADGAGGAGGSANADDQLLGLLGRALAVGDAPPQRTRDAAKAAYSWRTIDADLAQLVYDSSLEELAGVRGEDTARQVTFQAPGVEIEVMVVAEGVRRLVGQLVPPHAARIELVSGDEVREASSDDLGRFAFDGLEPGPLRLAVLGGSGERTIHTEWIVL